MVCLGRSFSQNIGSCEGKRFKSNIMYPTPITYDEDKKEEKNNESVINYPPICVNTEFDSLIFNSRLLESCNWYHSDFTSTDSKELLRKTPIGSFILRDSSDPNYLYCLSLKTKKGPTSIRIKYARGLFQLDCEDHIRKSLPRFDNIIALVDFHVKVSKSKLMEYQRVTSKRKNERISVTLLKPVLNTTGSLKHLARLAVNKSLNEIHIPSRSTDLLPIPDILKQYIREYTYEV